MSSGVYETGNYCNTYSVRLLRHNYLYKRRVVVCNMAWRASGVGDTRGRRCWVVPDLQIKQGRYILANEASMEEKGRTILEWLYSILLINLKNHSLINPDSISKASKFFGKFQVSLLNGHIFGLYWLKNDESYHLEIFKYFQG